jgi:predicted metal-dependent enzyme (double-stranded beta helix superfamily)
MPDAIHSVESIGNEATITFNLYGVTDFSRRYEFDRVNHTAKKF